MLIAAKIHGWDWVLLVIGIVAIYLGGFAAGARWVLERRRR